MRLRHAEKLKAIYFDEMESFERSKCLPLSIPVKRPDRLEAHPALFPDR